MSFCLLVSFYFSVSLSSPSHSTYSDIFFFLFLPCPISVNKLQSSSPFDVKYSFIMLYPLLYCITCPVFFSISERLDEKLGIILFTILSSNFNPDPCLILLGRVPFRNPSNNTWAKRVHSPWLNYNRGLITSTQTRKKERAIVRNCLPRFFKCQGIYLAIFPCLVNTPQIRMFFSKLV